MRKSCSPLSFFFFALLYRTGSNLCKVCRRMRRGGQSFGRVLKKVESVCVSLTREIMRNIQNIYIHVFMKIEKKPNVFFLKKIENLFLTKQRRIIWNFFFKDLENHFFFFCVDCFLFVCLFIHGIKKR